jgi:hypothetical protein
MNIQVPWKIRLKNGSVARAAQGTFWLRKRYDDELDVAKRPTLMVEDDLDHLGALHSEMKH